MKKPFLAFTLSFFLPGAGLAYLGLWKWAAINLAIVLATGIILSLLLSEEILDHYLHYIAIACSGASGGLAQALATQMNQKTAQIQETK